MLSLFSEKNFRSFIVGKDRAETVFSSKGKNVTAIIGLRYYYRWLTLLLSLAYVIITVASRYYYRKAVVIVA